jgi:hypothetical protein
VDDDELTITILRHELGVALVALAAAERRAEQVIDWVAGLLVDIGATQSQVDTMRDHVRTKILGDNDKP